MHYKDSILQNDLYAFFVLLLVYQLRLYFILFDSIILRVVFESFSSRFRVVFEIDSKGKRRQGSLVKPCVD